MEAIRRYLDEHLNRSMTPRTTVAIISIISMIASYADVFTVEDTEDVCRECSTRKRSKLMLLRDNVCYLRNMLLTMFQAANVFLLLGCVVENSTLMQLYIWYTLSFVVFGFMVTIIEFLSRIKCEQIWNFIALLADVLYLFVIFWCLPIIDSYRKSLGSGSIGCRASQDVI